VYACYRLLTGVCPSRFGGNRLEGNFRCNQLLRDPTFVERNRKVMQKIENFAECMATHRKQVNDHCLPLFKSACTTRPVRVAKVVRATMESMQQLLQLLPESRVIHLVRDPRAVVFSRRNYNPSGRSQYTQSTRNKSEQLIREASIYCRRVVDDVQWYRRLEQQFPGRLYSLTYEQLVSSTVGQANAIYRFIGQLNAPTSVIEKFTSLAKAGVKNVKGIELAFNWRRKLRPAELKSINDQCGDMLKLYPQYTGITAARIVEKHVDENDLWYSWETSKKQERKRESVIRLAQFLKKQPN
jgi:hypothetical protein